MKFIFSILIALTFISTAHAEEFQTLKRDNDFANLMSNLDFNAPNISFKYKDSGTSVGMKVQRDGKGLCKWVPRNAAADMEGQVVTYHLGRFLGMSELVMPSAYFKITGNSVAKFKEMLVSASEKNKWRSKNRNDLLAALSKDGSAMMGVVTPHLQFDSPEVKGLANASANTINSSHPIAKFIRATSPMPSTHQMSLDGVKVDGRVPTESELELARQFSMIMVLDILTGEWDRWSGGNVEAGTDGDRVFFFSRDNGGTSMSGSGVLKKYAGIVTRFDRSQIVRLQRLAELLSDPAEAAKIAAALDLSSNPKILLSRVQALLVHVQAQVEAHGENLAFFPPR